MSNERNKKTVQVQIFGTDYALKSDKDTEHVQSIAKYVDDKLEALAKNTNVKSQTKIAVLVALNIADELFRLRESHEAVQQQLIGIETQSKKICDSVDEHLNRYL